MSVSEYLNRVGTIILGFGLQDIFSFSVFSGRVHSIYNID